MQKKLILFLLFYLVGFSNLFAQPQMQFRHLPKIGDTVIVKNYFINDGTASKAFNPGPNGPNYSWSFTNLFSDSVITDTTVYEAIPNDSTQTMFPLANLRNYDLNNKRKGGFAYEYFRAEPSDFFLEGDIFFSKDRTGVDTVHSYSHFHTQHLTYVTLPTSYGDSLISFASGKIFNFAPSPCTDTDNYHVDRTYHVDGYGSLQLPGTTYDSVLRFHEFNIVWDTLNCNWEHRIINEYYNWYDVSYNGLGFKEPVLRYNIAYPYLPRQTEKSYYVFFIDNNYSGLQESPLTKSLVKAFYDPQNSQIIINPQSEELRKLNWRIVSMNGQTRDKGSISSIKQGEQFSLSGNSLVPGIYIFELYSEKEKLKTLKFYKN